MPREPRPQQRPENDDKPSGRPDVADIMKPLTHSADGETFETKDGERG